LQRLEGVASISALLSREVLAVSCSMRGDESPVAKLLNKYSDVPMSLADPTLLIE